MVPLKEKYTWIKHIDFILIDLACLIMAFFIAYYRKLGSINILAKPEWIAILIIICCMNFIFMVLQSTYSDILKRRYYEQFNRELRLVVSQIASICVIFYAFKIGTIFSREMMFTMYLIYFLAGQPIKYLWKKIINKEISFGKNERIDEEQEERVRVGSITRDLEVIDNRNEFLQVVSAFIKRTIDVIGALVGLLILIPLIGIVFILNKLNKEDDGPLFYTQERIGKDGKLFKLYKFRSMVVGADEKLERFLEENEDIREEFYVYRKIKNDPRITKVGKFLRKTSLDEFPQFINVLKGDMSIVGPRPYLPREREQMGKHYYIIIKYKPGITVSFTTEWWL